MRRAYEFFVQIPQTITISCFLISQSSIKLYGIFNKAKVRKICLKH